MGRTIKGVAKKHMGQFLQTFNVPNNIRNVELYRMCRELVQALPKTAHNTNMTATQLLKALRLIMEVKKNIDLTDSPRSTASTDADSSDSGSDFGTTTRHKAKPKAVKPKAVKTKTKPETVPTSAPISAPNTVLISAPNIVPISAPSAKSKDMNTSQMDAEMGNEMDDAEIDGVQQEVNKRWNYIEKPTTISPKELASILEYVYDNKAPPCMRNKQGVRRQIDSIGKYKANGGDSKLVSFTVLNDGSYKSGWIRRKTNKASFIPTFNRWYLSGDTLDQIILCE
jgi:hypothetical protein